MMMFLILATCFLVGCNRDFDELNQDHQKSILQNGLVSPSSCKEIDAQSSNLAYLNESEKFYQWASAEGYPEAQILYAQILLRKNETQEGYMLLKNAYHKGYDEALLIIAQNLADQGKIEEALLSLEPLLDQEKKPQAYLLAANFSEKMGQQDQAYQFLEKAAKIGSCVAEQKIIEYRQPSSRDWKLFLEYSAQNLSEDYETGLYAQPVLASSQKTSQAHVETIYPREFLKMFRNAAEKGSSYAALSELVFARNYPTLFEGSDTLYRNLILRASVLPAGKSFYARAIFDGSMSEPYEKAWSLLQEAADHKDPYALFALSFYYRERGFLDKALAYYQDGLNQPQMADELFSVIVDILEKKIALRSPHAAYDALAFLAYSGHPASQVYLASLKETKLIEGSQEEILSLLHRAAWANDHYAQYLLGSAYFYGQKGLEINMTKAWRWLLKSARSGYRPAQYTLGQWYWNQAYEQPGSKIEAYAWKRISLEGLKEEPLEWLRDIEKELSWSELELAVLKSQQYHDFYNKTVRIEMPALLAR